MFDSGVSRQTKKVVARWRPGVNMLVQAGAGRDKQRYERDSKTMRPGPNLGAGRDLRRWRRGSGDRSRTVIHQIFQFLTGLEKWNLLRRNLNSITGLWISTDTRLALARAETAKTTDLNLVPHTQ